MRKFLGLLILVIFSTQVNAAFAMKRPAIQNLENQESKKRPKAEAGSQPAQQSQSQPAEQSQTPHQPQPAHAHQSQTTYQSQPAQSYSTHKEEKKTVHSDEIPLRAGEDPPIDNDVTMSNGGEDSNSSSSDSSSSDVCRHPTTNDLDLDTKTPVDAKTSSQSQRLPDFRSLLGPNALLTSKAIAYWLKEEGLIGKHFFEPNSYKPINALLRIDEIRNFRGKSAKQIFEISTVDPNTTIFKKRYFVKAVSKLKGAEQENRGLSFLNQLNLAGVRPLQLKQIFCPDRPKVNSQLISQFPRLALKEASITLTVQDQTVTFMMLHAAAGLLVADWLSIIKEEEISIEDARKMATILGTSLGAFHFAHLRDETQPFDEAVTYIHNDLITSNLFYDARYDRIHFIDNGGFRLGHPWRDLHPFLHDCRVMALKYFRDHNYSTRNPFVDMINDFIISYSDHFGDKHHIATLLLREYSPYSAAPTTFDWGQM